MQLVDVAPCQKELRVEVPRETIDAEFEVVYKEFKRFAHVPGFRVGFAPRDLLERYHGKKVQEEVLKRLIAQSLEEAFSGKGRLDLIGRPQVSEVQFDPKQSLTYRARIEIAPEVPLGPYKKLKLTKPKSQVTQEQVAQVLNRLQDDHAQLRPVLEPRSVAAGDYLLVDLTEQAAGKSPVKRRDVVIHLNLEKEPESPLKGLIGMKPSEERQVKLEGGVAVTVHLKQIKTKELAPLDDAFAKTVGPFETLDALRQAIRRDLEKQWENSVRQQLEGQIQHQLRGWPKHLRPPRRYSPQLKC